ncbi:MAG: hypothetical protein JKX97_00735 [Candidatus Lindowbacteria bacterium]|nr:hypothetical protein [Candidatus Lindowbacteria bacterium]
MINVLKIRIEVAKANVFALALIAVDEDDASVRKNRFALSDNRQVTEPNPTLPYAEFDKAATEKQLALFRPEKSRVERDVEDVMRGWVSGEDKKFCGLIANKDRMGLGPYVHKALKDPIGENEISLDKEDIVIDFEIETIDQADLKTANSDDSADADVASETEKERVPLIQIELILSPVTGVQAGLLKNATALPFRPQDPSHGEQYFSSSDSTDTFEGTVNEIEKAGTGEVEVVVQLLPNLVGKCTLPRDALVKITPKYGDSVTSEKLKKEGFPIGMIAGGVFVLLIILAAVFLT